MLYSKKAPDPEETNKKIMTDAALDLRHPPEGKVRIVTHKKNGSLVDMRCTFVSVRCGSVKATNDAGPNTESVNLQLADVVNFYTWKGGAQ